MQTTLLGLASIIILALLAALVGPLFIDWGGYRASIEAEASRVIGAPVRIAGAIDVRLLPTPYLALQSVTVGDGGALRVSMPALQAELALGPLLRGQWQVDELRLTEPDIEADLDGLGRIKDAAGEFQIAAVVVDNGRLTASRGGAAKLGIGNLSFTGSAQSLAGPLKGEGGFTIGAQRYAFRVAAGRRGEDGGAKLHFALDFVDRPLTFESDGALYADDGALRYDGSATLRRIAGLAVSGGRAVLGEPWRATGKVKATPASALIEQIEVEHGPTERAINLTGTANVSFGATPEIDAVLAGRQIDFDRALASTDVSRHLPSAALRALIDKFSGEFPIAMPMKLGIGIDGAILGGATLQAVHGDLRFDASGWTIETFDLRAPGYTSARLSGRIDARSRGFTGPIDIQSDDPRTLVAWLEGKPEAATGAINPLRLRGDLTVGSERIGIERLRAELDRKTFEGRLAYLFANDQHPTRLEADIKAADIDADSLIAFGQAVTAGSTLDWPREIAATADIGRATLGGVEAKTIKADVRLDSGGLKVEQFSAADFGGASINARGAIDIGSSPPTGAVTLSLDAAKTDGLAALMAKFTGEGLIKQTVSRLAPAKLEITANVGGANSTRLAVNGKAGPLQVKLAAESGGTLATWRDAALKLDGTLTSDSGTALASLLGLDRVFVLDRRPASVTFSANGVSAGALRVDGRWAGSGFDLTSAGTLRLGDNGLLGDLDLALVAADAGALLHTPLPVNLSGRLALSDRDWSLQNVSGVVAGVPTSGQGKLIWGDPSRIEAHVVTDRLAVAPLLAAMIGMPPSTDAAPWAQTPFSASIVPRFDGAITVEATQAALTPGVAVRNLRGNIRLAADGVVFDTVEGLLGGGRFSAGLSLSSANGASIRGQLKVVNADAAAVLPSLVGRLSTELEVEGSGLSPAALMGSLRGSGNVTLESAQIAGLDLKIFDVAERAVDRGLRIDAARINDVANRVFDDGSLILPFATAPIAIAEGRLQLGPVTMRGAPNDPAVSGGIDLTTLTVDGRMTLFGPPRPGIADGKPPEISALLRGPIGQPRRVLDITALVNWMTLVAVDRETKRLEAAERASQKDAPRSPTAASAVLPVPQAAPALPVPIFVRPTPGAARPRSAPSRPLLLTPQP